MMTNIALPEGLGTDGRQLLVQHLLEDYLRLHRATQDALSEAAGQDPLKTAEALSRLATAFTRVVDAVGRASPDLSRLAMIADFITELRRFIQARYPQHVPALLAVLEPFADHLTNTSPRT